MTRRQREVLRMTWPMVAIVAILAASIMGLFYMSTPEGRSSVLAVLIATCTSIVSVIVQRLNNKFDRDSRRQQHHQNRQRRSTDEGGQ